MSWAVRRARGQLCVVALAGPVVREGMDAWAKIEVQAGTRGVHIGMTTMTMRALKLGRASLMDGMTGPQPTPLLLLPQSLLRQRHRLLLRRRMMTGRTGRPAVDLALGSCLMDLIGRFGYAFSIHSSRRVPSQWEHNLHSGNSDRLKKNSINSDSKNTVAHNVINCRSMNEPILPKNYA
jgi:hypothetical protein